MPRYYADVGVVWGVDMDADSEKDFIAMLKENYKQDYNIELQDDEIINIRIT